MNMDADEQVKIYSKGVKAGKEHAQPSPETKKRFEKLEKSIAGIQRDLAVFIQETRDYHKGQDERQSKILEQTTKHNGRMTKMEMWQARFDGGRLTLKGLWGLLGVFIIAAVFGLFQMYLAYQQLPYIISQEVTSQLEYILTE